MKPSQNLVNYMTQLATRVARRCNLDPDTTLSVAAELAIEAAARVEDEVDSFKLFNVIARKRLVADVCTQLRVFGPSATALRMRRMRNTDNGERLERKPYDLVLQASKPNRINMVDFFDQFSHDPKLLEFVSLLVAGYNQTELISQYGYTRQQIANYKKDIEDVYSK